MSSFAAAANIIDLRLEGVTSLLEGVYRTQLEQQEVLQQVLKGQTELLQQQSHEKKLVSSPNFQPKTMLNEEKNKKEKTPVSKISSESCQDKNHQTIVDTGIQKNSPLLGTCTTSIVESDFETASIDNNYSTGNSGEYHHNYDKRVWNSISEDASGYHEDIEEKLYNNAEISFLDADVGYRISHPYLGSIYNSIGKHDSNDINPTEEPQRNKSLSPPRKVFSRRLVSSDGPNLDENDDDDKGEEDEEKKKRMKL